MYRHFGLAPVITINDDVYGRLVPEDVEGIIKSIRIMRDLSLHIGHSTKLTFCKSNEIDIIICAHTDIDLLEIIIKDNIGMDENF